MLSQVHISRHSETKEPPKKNGGNRRLEAPKGGGRRTFCFMRASSIFCADTCPFLPASLPNLVRSLSSHARASSAPSVPNESSLFIVLT